ncbi:MAG: hypothetical protein DRI57_04045 [Deltaproteobacteria bacterium]|nr:MAG: hypothetical protein DRI57_04045 [Deltaproteobacteria bacterium]
MHKHILTKEQKELLPLIRQFRKDYYLAGGTAVALYLGHRRSVDFDLFSHKSIRRRRIKNIIEAHHLPTKDVLFEAHDQLHLVVNCVKMTFFHFPHTVTPRESFEKIIRIPPLSDLAAMKAYALGGRAKWKDYVDLYFLLKDHFDLKTISCRAKDIFGRFFNEKLFREQLAYFDDIDYREEVEFIGKEIAEKEIRDFLTETALAPF